jgi:hypothetical protein
MQVNRNNYEACLLDYLEGSLDKRGRAELALFFEQNPDLNVDIDEYKITRLKPDTTLVYYQKHLLKKIEIQQFELIHQVNYEEWIIACLEGDLSKNEQNQFHGFLKLNPEVQREVTAFKHTFFTPDQSIKYQPKEGLKKKVPFYYHGSILWPSAVAALMIILFGILMLLQNESQTPGEQKNILTEQLDNPLTQPAENKVIQDTISTQIPASEALPQLNKPVSPEEDKPLLAKVEDLPMDLRAGDNSGKEEDKSLEVEHIEKLERITFSGQLQTENIGITQMPGRDEMTIAFEYLVLRDALKEDRDGKQKEKSTFGKVFASLGNKIFGSTSDESGSLLSDLTNRGKESFAGFSEAMPVYRESYESGRTNTYFALSENLKLRISKNKNKQEAPGTNGRE